MLALCHHFLVQFAYWRTGGSGWFTLYLVLGDDIVIFEPKVAASYRSVMDDLGVGISYAKSLESKTSFEFAKRFAHLGVSEKIVSFRELDVASSSLDALMELLRRHRGTNFKLSLIMKLKGYSYRTLATLTKPLVELPAYRRGLLIFSSYPGNSPWSFTKFTEWLTMTAIGRHSSIVLKLDSLRDRLLVLFERTMPIGDSSVLTPRDIYGPTKLLNPKYHWKLSFTVG